MAKPGSYLNATRHPLPGLQWLHHVPFGFSSSPILISLQQSEQLPHARPGAAAAGCPDAPVMGSRAMPESSIRQRVISAEGCRAQ